MCRLLGIEDLVTYDVSTAYPRRGPGDVLCTCVWLRCGLERTQYSLNSWPRPREEMSMLCEGSGL